MHNQIEVRTALVSPLLLGSDPEVAELAAFFNATLGFPPNSSLTMQRRPEIARTFIALNRAVMDRNATRLVQENRSGAIATAPNASAAAKNETAYPATTNSSR